MSKHKELVTRLRDCNKVGFSNYIYDDCMEAANVIDNLSYKLKQTKWKFDKVGRELGEQLDERDLRISVMSLDFADLHRSFKNEKASNRILTADLISEVDSNNATIGTLQREIAACKLCATRLFRLVDFNKNEHTKKNYLKVYPWLADEA